MNCPVCGDVTLSLAERQGIEIDYCPQCRGVWLDRGELDKIIERSVAEHEPPREPPRREKYREPPREYERRTYDDDDYKDKYYHKKRKKSFLSEIFDFD